MKKQMLTWGAVVALVLSSTGAFAQEMAVSLRLVPELTMTAPIGTTNVLQGASELGDNAQWEDLATVLFLNDRMVYVDQRLQTKGMQYYRMVQATNFFNINPPFLAPSSNLVWLPPGQFVIGSSAGDADALGEEQPQMVVNLNAGFFMGLFEVTQGEYASLVGSNPSEFTGDDLLPVDNVNWSDATNYCGVLNAREKAAGRLPLGYEYRLPYEAEWEYAARFGSTNRFSYGNDADYSQLPEYAWYAENSGEMTHVVGTKQATAKGLFDLSGNVAEWCMDWFGYYPGGTVSNFRGADSGTEKVLRGGSCLDPQLKDLRPAARRNMDPSIRFKMFGFRVVLAPVNR